MSYSAAEGFIGWLQILRRMLTDQLRFRLESFGDGDGDTADGNDDAPDAEGDGDGNGDVPDMRCEM